MNNKLIQKIIKLSYQLVENGDNRHLTFLLKRNKIIKIGLNDRKKTHPFCKKKGYTYCYLHSETDLVSGFSPPYNELKGCRVVNVRISPSRLIRCSKPCFYCEKLLLTLPIKDIWFSTDEGNFTKNAS